MSSFPTVDLSSFDFSKLEFPRFDLPKIDLPRFDLPDVDLPDADRVLGFARDAAYVGIGLAVLGAQQVQVRGRELVATVRNGVDQLRDALI